ncbi:UvrD-helicase domain-containing protein [Microbulbifer sp. MCCC 1A16149]|uniref:UvrD-helicase domain-containing protein n=1 Tax=Microbulbifer sp. MCCC 1A16149 TaxID=3411322 RepID=UPI003D138CBE
MSDFEYTPDQKAAITSNSNMVITACPGSGKTTVVAEKIRNEVKDLPPYKGVIGITFTVKASKELRQRCKKNACDTKMSFFGTIDHFCLSEIIHPFLARVLDRKKHQLECIKFDEIPEFVLEKLSVIPHYSDEVNSTSFKCLEDDISTLFDHGFVLLELLGVIANYVIAESHACQRYIAAKYSSVYIDEYQDSSEPQHALFLKLLELGLVGVAVGDVQQSIYAWRGSDPEFIKELTNNPDVFEHHIVNINHRCHPSITNYSNRLYDAECDLLPASDVRVYRRHYTGTQVDVTEKINESIEIALKKNIVESYSQIGILVRNNISLEFLSNGLNVPFRIFDEDPLAVRNTRVCNLFSQLLRFRYDEHHRLNDVVEYIQSFTPISKNRLSVLRETISTIGDKVQDELSRTIVDITGEVLNIDISASDKELINAICLDSKLLQHYKPINENEVQVMTLHKSKGLEFELVYHLDLYDWIHPKRKFVRGCFDVIYDNWEQELNLHFVGITRAKNYCVLVTSNSRLNRAYETKTGNPSQFFSLPGLDGLYR